MSEARTSPQVIQAETLTGENAVAIVNGEAANLPALTNEEQRRVRKQVVTWENILRDNHQEVIKNCKSQRELARTTINAARRIGNILCTISPHGGDRRSKDFSFGEQAHLKQRVGKLLVHLKITEHYQRLYRTLAKIPKEQIVAYFEHCNVELVEPTASGLVGWAKPKPENHNVDEETTEPKRTDDDAANSEPSNQGGGEATEEKLDTDDYLTPLEVVEFVQMLFGRGPIDIDPCASLVAETNGHSTVKARTRFTKDHDGLRQEWSGSVFINPPYSAPEPWVDRVVDEVNRNAGIQIAMLVNACTDTAWFSKLRSFPRAYIRRRLQFLEPKSGKPARYTARASSVLVYTCRDKIDHFARLASKFVGDVYQLYKPFDPLPPEE